MIILNILSFFLCILIIRAETSLEEDAGVGRYVMEGLIYPISDYKNQSYSNKNWQSITRVHVNGGEYIGFVKRDGSFAIHNVPSGSYVVEVLHPEYTFEPVRVEINSKGKFRARKVNHIQTSLVTQVPYPLKMKALGKTRYFHAREQWRVTDFLFNPMVMMMLFPVLLIMVLPKLMNDPETKKDLEEIQKMTNINMPEMSDLVSNYLAGGQQGSSKEALKDKEGRKGQKPKKKVLVRE